MSASATKFTFDLDMGEHLSARSVVKKNQQTIAIETAKEEAYKAGFLAGETSEQSRTSQAILSGSQKLIEIANKMLSDHEKMRKNILSHSISLSIATGKKLAAHLIAAQPEVELEALIKECLSSLEDVPHLVIHCHPDLAKQCNETATKLMQTSRFSGNLVIMGDEEIALGDGKIEWVDGGLIRDSENILNEIDASILNYISAHNIKLDSELSADCQTDKIKLKENNNG